MKFPVLDNKCLWYYNGTMNLNLENLNPQQRLAVETTDGPLLVLSGAGTGKTRVLTTRIAYILNNHLAMPWNVLALTFTNKAANEMKTRLSSISSGDWYSGDIWCGTFHSICLRILRANAERLDMRRDFLIYGEDDQKSVIKTILANHGTTTKTPGDFVEEFSSIKDKGLSALQNKDKLFNAYNAELRRLNAVDFGDIILRVLELFDKFPEILARYQAQFKYILVDEFQDTNNAQMEFLSMLTRGNENPNICCVGDDDQSIYSWRGAEIKHILNFDKTYANAQIIRLETNYRSTANILGAANSLIRHNNGRLGKDLHHGPNVGDGEPVYVLTLPSDLDEARIIADSILRDDAHCYSNYTVLIRSGSLSRLFEEAFAVRSIPYKLIGATKFYDRTEIRDAIAYLRLLVFPFDDMSFLRVIGKPRRGFGERAIEKLRASGTNLMAALRDATGLTAKQKSAADEFLSAFDFEWETMVPRDAAQTLLDRAGYIKMWTESKDADAADRLSNIRELVTGVISKYDTIADFLEQAALMMTDDNDTDVIEGNMVSIMTIHAAKGLEFDTVFLPAWEEGIFPNEKSIGEGAIEEERRLAYVAITRARRRCIISNAMSRMIFGSRQYNSPSRFITEIDNRYLDFQGSSPRTTTYRPTVSQSYDARPKPRPTIAPSAKGKMVSHPEMGMGVVIDESGDILTIAFKTRGIKKVARDYVKFLG